MVKERHQKTKQVLVARNSPIPQSSLLQSPTRQGRSPLSKSAKRRHRKDKAASANRADDGSNEDLSAVIAEEVGNRAEDESSSDESDSNLANASSVLETTTSSSPDRIRLSRKQNSSKRKFDQLIELLSTVPNLSEEERARMIQNCKSARDGDVSAPVSVSIPSISTLNNPGESRVIAPPVISNVADVTTEKSPEKNRINEAEEMVELINLVESRDDASVSGESNVQNSVASANPLPSAALLVRHQYHDKPPRLVTSKDLTLGYEEPFVAACDYVVRHKDTIGVSLVACFASDLIRDLDAGWQIPIKNGGFGKRDDPPSWKEMPPEHVIQRIRQFWIKGNYNLSKRSDAGEANPFLQYTLEFDGISKLPINTLISNVREELTKSDDLKTAWFDEKGGEKQALKQFHKKILGPKDPNKSEQGTARHVLYERLSAKLEQEVEELKTFEAYLKTIK